MLILVRRRARPPRAGHTHGISPLRSATPFTSLRAHTHARPAECLPAQRAGRVPSGLPGLRAYGRPMRRLDDRVAHRDQVEEELLASRLSKVDCHALLVPAQR